MRAYDLSKALLNFPADAEVRVASVGDDEGRAIAGVEPASNLPGQAARVVFLREEHSSDLPQARKAT
jgi:hypothetical protein